MKKLLWVFFMMLFAKPAYAVNIVGLWESLEKDYVYFAEDGKLYFPNSTVKAGNSWKLENDSLTTTLFYVSAIEQTEDVYKVTYDNNTLLLEKKDGKKISLKRSDKKLSLYEGEIFYRERIALPPSVEVRYSLYKNNEKSSFMYGSKVVEGQIPLPIKLYYIANESDEIYIKPEIFYGDEKLFTTCPSVSVNEKKVMLKRDTGSSTIDTIPTPSKFVAENGDIIFLERNGLAILQSEEKYELAHWSQVDRNHTVEIIGEDNTPILATLSNNEDLIFQHYKDKGAVSFKSKKGKFNIGILNLHGIIYEKNDKDYFIEHISEVRFPVKLIEALEKSSEFDKFHKTKPVLIKGALVRNEADTLDLYALELIEVYDKDKDDSQHHSAVLDNTYWRLTNLNNKPVKIYENQREPHFILRDKMISGSDGCNNFFMPAEIENDKITLKQGGSTLMLCPQGQEQATEFLQTLSKVTKWSIKGSILRLMVNEDVVATFEAVYL